MTSILIPTVNQLFLMFFFMIIGYIFNKLHLGGDRFESALSSLEVNVFLPATVFSSFCNNFNIEIMNEYLSYLIAGIITIVLTFFVAKVLSEYMADNPLQKDILMYSFLIPNLGYMGYPIIEAVFGADALLSMMIFVIPFNIMIFTYGVYILNPKRDWSLKSLFNPNMIFLVFGIICGIFKVKIPDFLNGVITSAKGCMSTIAMILSGYILGSVPIKDAFSDKKAYIAAALRGIIIPLTALAVAYIIGIRGMLLTIIIGTLCMPLGMNTVVFPAAMGGDSKTGARFVLISNIFCIITIPAVFAVVQFIA